MDINILPILKNKISIFKGDITKLKADCIVNAANKSLLGGGGVDAAIHKAAGKELKQYCRTLGRCNTGEAKITPGYNLPSKYIIHTVGPRGEKPTLLAKCYQQCLLLMDKHQLETICFCCISTGVYGYPQEPAAKIAVNQVEHYIQNNPNTSIKRVVFCCFLEKDYLLYKNLLS